MNFLDASLNTDGKGYFLEIGGDSLVIPPQKANENLKSYVGRSVKLGVRPEDIRDDAASVAANPGTIINTSVDVSEKMGSEVYLHLKYGNSILTARVPPTTTSKIGDNIQVSLNMDKMHLFDVESEAAILN
jgi:multiple sugar transport system ATP-binding protein